MKRLSNIFHLALTIDTLYNGQPVHTIFFDKIDQSICIGEVQYKGQKLIPEKIMRRVHLFYTDFFKFVNYLEEIISLYDVWQTPLITNFTVKGGWEIPKAPLILAKMTVASLQQYARWFWMLTNEWVICCEFTQNEINDLEIATTDTYYTGKCTMNVKYSIVCFEEVKHFFLTRMN